MSNSDDGHVRLIMSKHVNEDELKKTFVKLLKALANGTAQRFETPYDVDNLASSEDAKINRERKPEPEVASTGPDAG